MRNLSSVFTLVSMLLPLTIMPVQAYEYVNPNDGYKACMFQRLSEFYGEAQWKSADRLTKTYWKGLAHRVCK